MTRSTATAAAQYAVDTALLRRRSDHLALGFSTTAELTPARHLIGQERALAAIHFSAAIDKSGFNLFVLGPPGLGKKTAVRNELAAHAAGAPSPDDWVYVNNFDMPHRPRAIRLPRGRARQFERAMVAAIDELRTAIPALFEGEAYQSRHRAIDEQSQSDQEAAFETLNREAQAENIAILRTPMGFAMAPIKDGKVIKPEAFNQLPQGEQNTIQEKIEALQEKLQMILEKAPRVEKERRQAIRALNEELAGITIKESLADIDLAFSDIADIVSHLRDVERDLISNIALFLNDPNEGNEMVAERIDSARDARFRRYMVNVMIAAADDAESGTPILEEDNPTLGNLVGRVEHLSQMGTLVTDFLLIKPGILHKANGGFLLLDARRVLMQPFAWEALKRAIKTEQISIESPAEQLSMISTVSLDPDHIPLRLRVVLFGDPMLYYLLSAFDPDFSSLFKVAADFDDAMSRDDDQLRTYAQLIASIVEQHQLLHVGAGGVALLFEESARLAHDAEKLSLRVEALSDLLCEADFWARQAGRALIGEDDVRRAVRESIFRQDRLRERTQEAILRDIMLIDTSGVHIGQINGLSVLSLGNFAFGKPSRITARVRMGAGKLVDIEREVELGGALHSKGVMILRGFLEGRYAHEVPLALSASLVFEQSYGGVDGDSASSAELYALLSALAEVPIKQSLAVTGSVNQHGQVQAIGGVNEKIEGFFDLCVRRGLSGEHGVVIPKANIAHLMLREDVVNAVSKGDFHVYAVDTIDRGIEILTGLPAGDRGADGLYPEGSVNRKVEDRLIAFAEARRLFGASSEKGKINASGGDG